MSSVVPTVSVCQKSPVLGCVLNNARGTGVEQLRFEIPAMSNVSVHIYHLQSNWVLLSLEEACPRRCAQCQWADPPRLLPNVASITMVRRTMDYPARVWAKPPDLVHTTYNALRGNNGVTWNNLFSDVFLFIEKELWLKEVEVGEDRILIEQVQQQQHLLLFLLLSLGPVATSLKEKYWILGNTFRLLFHREKFY